MNTKKKESTSLTPLYSLEGLLESPSLPDPQIYQYYRNLAKRRIIINDVIDSNIVESAILPLLEMDNDGTGEEIEIVLCTNGGCVFDGMALCDVIDGLKTKTTITILTYGYSMGSLIAIAGFNNPNVTKRCYKHSTCLFHGGVTYLEGNSNAVKDTFEFYQKYDEKIKEYTISHSKITEDEYHRLERYEWYMTAETMLEKGIVDEII